jgi:Protein of unknown function (DUF2690)
MRRTRVIKALLGTACVLSLTFGLVTPASAATCYRQSCNGLDPQATGCSGTSTGTLDSFTWNGVFVELRLSGTCSAAWTRSTYSRCDNNAAGYVWTEAYYDAAGTQWAGQSAVPISCNGQASWTSMFSFYFYVRSCIQINGVFKYCTRLH